MCLDNWNPMYLLVRMGKIYFDPQSPNMSSVSKDIRPNAAFMINVAMKTLTDKKSNHTHTHRHVRRKDVCTDHRLSSCGSKRADSCTVPADTLCARQYSHQRDPPSADRDRPASLAGLCQQQMCIALQVIIIIIVYFISFIVSFPPRIGAQTHFA